MQGQLPASGAGPVSPRMARLNLLLASLLPLATSQFIPPEAILQAGYPAGFRAFVPDFPGCQQFAFHGKINSPFIEDNELGSIFQEILRPQDGFWIVQDFKLILNPGDIIHYWTNIVKDGIPYPKHNQTWKVPGPEGSVDLLTPIKPPKKTPPEKVKMTETPPTEEVSTPTPNIETDATVPTTIDETTPAFSETSTPNSTLTTTTDTVTTKQTSPSTKKSTTPSTTTMKPTTAAKTTSIATTTTTTTKKPPTSEKRETPNPKPAKNPPPTEEIEEFTTPPSLERQFSDEPPEFPFPGLFPQPFKPMMPSQGPGFEICSNPWNFEERIGETRTQKLERQVAKLQCQLALFQRGYNQLSNTVETELTDLKKLMYGMVSRMASLESVLRSTPFG